jgi:TolA-binding protein
MQTEGQTRTSAAQCYDVENKEALVRIMTLAAVALALVVGCGKKGPDDKTLFEEGQKLEAAEQFSQAFETYKNLSEKFPKSSYRYKALFLAGFIQFEQLNNRKLASEYFEKLIHDYPTCDLADDAAVLRDIAQSGRDIMSVFEDSVGRE